MDCVFGPIWLHSLDWAHHVDDTRTGILQGVRCGMNENADLDVCQAVNEFLRHCGCGTITLKYIV